MRKNKNQKGFVPLLVCLAIILGAVIWFSFKHVNDAHKAKDAANQIKNLQNENPINR